MRKRIWRVIAVGIAATLTAAAAGAEDTVQLLPSPLVLPKRIGPLMLSGAPHAYQDPALGVSYQYSGQGLSLTVYIYDGGDTGIADGADTKATCEEFEIAKQGVAQAYQKTQLKSEQLVRLDPPAELPLAREAVYEYEREAHPTISYIWITAAAKYFVKLRFSVDPSLRDELPDARRAVLSILGDAIKPHLKPVDPKAATPGTSLGFNLGGGSDDVMQAGIVYLMLLNATADKMPELAPVCGGEIVPTLDTEASLYRGMFSLDEDLAKTKFGKRIAQIDEAGFLEEFLWVDHHREAWGLVPPKELTLPEFEAWRGKKLRRFRSPQFGTVTIDHPRPLPLEPAAP
jgi:hypothetical protein